MSIPNPSWTSSKLIKFDVAASPMKGSYRRRKRGSIKFLEYTLVYQPGQLDTTRAQELITQHSAVKGRANSFQWTPWNSSTAIEVRFGSDELDIDVASLVAYGTTITLIKEPS